MDTTQNHEDITMRKFTKTHNDLKWLFPIAKTQKEASKVFDYVEENAQELCHAANIPEKAEIWQ